MDHHDLGDNNDFGKHSRKRRPHESAPWYKRYPRDFFDATRCLTGEQRGYFNDVCDLIYMNDGPIADDSRHLAFRLCVDLRVWKRVRNVLLAHGFLYIVHGKLMNKRCKEVLAERQVERRCSAQEPKLGAHLEKSSFDFNGPKSVEVESESEVDSTTLPAQPTLIDIKALWQRLQVAGGDALVPEASHPGIAVMTIPLMWINSGCSLDLDILPIVETKCRGRTPRSIKSWKYFTQAVMEAKAERTTPAPDAQVSMFPRGRDGRLSQQEFARRAGL